MARARECMSRRQWLAAGATLAGYALAAAPSLAQAVRTDEAGLATSRAEISVGDVAMPVYEARPAAAAKAPIVVLVSEIWGVHEYIRDCARRFAKAGYCAVAPELFARAGGVAQIADTQTLLIDRKSTRLNSSHLGSSYAVFCLKKKSRRYKRRSS